MLQGQANNPPNLDRIININGLIFQRKIVGYMLRQGLHAKQFSSMMSGGKVVDHGVPGRLWESASEWSQQFLNGKPDGPVPFHYPATGYREDLLEGGRCP